MDKCEKTILSDTPHYENEVPFEIPDSWEWTTLGTISNYGNCNNVDVNGIPDDSWIVELEDIEKDSAKILQRLTKGEREIKGVRHSFRKGEVLYSKLRTYLNKVLVANEEGFCTTEIIPISCYSNVLPEYLNHVLRSKYFVDYTIQCGYGVKMPRLSTSDACNGLIPLPPYNEQKCIVNSIECWFKIIDTLESDKKELDETIVKAKSKILDLAIHGELVPQDSNDEPAIELLKRINPSFVPCDNAHCPYDIPSGWEWSKGSMLFVKMESCKPIGKDFIYIDVDAIDNKQNKIANPKILLTSNAPSRATRKLHTGDVLFSMVRPYLKNIALVTDDYRQAIGSTGFYVLSPIKVIHSSYLFYMMLSSYVIDGLNEFMKGDNSPSINNKNIEEFLYPVPPYNEQQRIVEKIEKLFAVLDEIKESLEA